MSRFTYIVKVPAISFLVLKHLHRVFLCARSLPRQVFRGTSPWMVRFPDTTTISRLQTACHSMESYSPTDSTSTEIDHEEQSSDPPQAQTPALVLLPLVAETKQHQSKPSDQDPMSYSHSREACKLYISLSELMLGDGALVDIGMLVDGGLVAVDQAAQVAVGQVVHLQLLTTQVVLRISYSIGCQQHQTEFTVSVESVAELERKGISFKKTDRTEEEKPSSDTTGIIGFFSYLRGFLNHDEQPLDDDLDFCDGELEL